MDRIALTVIAFDAGTQIREAINEPVVSEYAERMAEGVTFPPVVLFHDGTRYYLADGFHRYMAAQRNGFVDMDATVQAGTKEDALWFALGANKANGQRLTERDKQHAVALALAMWPAKMQREIAEQVGCSESLVSKVVMDTAKANGGETGIRGRALATQQKRDAVRAAVLAGKQSVDIRRELHAHSELIAGVRRELGKSGIDYSRSAVKERRARMRQMAADGYTSRQIAADMGISEEGCRRTLREEGIDVPADAVAARTRRHDSTRIIEHIVMDAENLTADVNLIDFDALDGAQIAEWLRSLTESRDKLGAFIRRLVKEQQKHGEAA